MRDDAVRDSMVGAYAGPSTSSYRTREEQQYAASLAGHSYATRDERRLVIVPCGNPGPSTAAYRGHEEQQYAAAQASQQHPGPGGSSMNNPYGNPTTTCTPSSTSSTSDIVCVYDIRVQCERGTQTDKVQKRQRGGKRTTLAVVEKTQKRQRYDTPKEQPSTSQQVVDDRPRVIVEPISSTSRKPMPVQNTEQQNRRDQDSGSTHTHPPCGHQNGLRHDQSRIRHGRDPEPRVAPPVVLPPTSQLNVPGPANIEALNIVGIIPRSGHYLVRHTDNSVHEYVLVHHNQSVIDPEDIIRAPPIATSHVTPEIYVTPRNDDMPPSPGAIEQVIGECMEIDDEVD